MTDPAEIALGLCPNLENHTPAPDGYLQRYAWAKAMAKTHKQRQCKGCGLFAIWEPRQHLKEADDAA